MKGRGMNVESVRKETREEREEGKEERGSMGVS